MGLTPGVFAALVLALLASAEAAEPSIGYPYTFKLNTGAGSFVQTVSANSATGVACTSDADCQSKCPTTDFSSGNANVATIQQQLYDCANAFRTSPNSFANQLNAQCTYSAFQNEITTPRRPALAVSSRLADLAEAHTNDMAANNSFSHTSTNGQNPADRIRAAFPAANAIGEVIAAGYTNVQAVIVNLMCSESHRGILTSCDYDTAGWGAAYGSMVNGQPTRSTYSSYFTGDFLCSTEGGCSCNAPAPAAAPPTSPTATPAAQTTPVASPTPQPVASPTPQPVASPPPPVPVTPPAPTPTPVATPPAVPATPQPTPAAPPSQPPPLATATAPGAQSTGAVAVTFNVVFSQIPASSLNAAQTASVIDDLRRAIAGYISPVTAGININGSGPAPSRAPTAPPTAAAAARPSAATSQSGTSQTGSSSTTSGASSTTTSASTSTSGGSTATSTQNGIPIVVQPGRRLQQSENTYQATTRFLATTTAPSSAASGPLVSALTTDITNYNAPVSVTVTATPVTTGSTLALQVAVQFPPNNQVSSDSGYTTQLADSFGSAAANRTASTFPTYTAANGALAVSNVSTTVVPVAATAGTNLGPGPPVRVISSGPSGNPGTATPSAPTPQAGAVPPTSPAPVTPASPPQTPTNPNLPTLPAGPTTPVPPTRAPAVPAPAPGPGLPLVLSATVTFRDNQTALIQNITQTLQSNPQAVLYTVIARDGNITVNSVQNSAGSGAAIEEAPPEGPTAPTTGEAGPSAAPGPQSSELGCSLYALNMQFTTGQAATDQPSATLLAAFPTSAGPQASSFTVLLSDGGRGAVDTVIPYAASYFLVRVTTPDGYYGPVTVSYSTAQLESLQYVVVRSLVVKVTASSLTAASR